MRAYCTLWQRDPRDRRWWEYFRVPFVGTEAVLSVVAEHDSDDDEQAYMRL